METINGNTNNSQWTFKLEATETAYSLANKTSTVKVQVYLGRASSQSYLGGNYNLSVKCAEQTQNQNGNIPYPTYINAGAWLLLKTFTFTVSNTQNPTTISISSSMSSSDFTPSSANASGNLTLTKLHDAPLLTDIIFEEKNQQLINIGVGDDYFVTNLSIKNLEIEATTSDNATITKYEVLNGDKIYESTTNVVSMNLKNNILETIYDNNLKREVAQLTIRLTDNLGGVSEFAYPYNYVIPYTKPAVEATSTTIKRKTGNGTVLTDNKALLNFVGTCYKGNDVVGNNNKPKVEYKIWNTTEPNYSTLTTPNSANVTIKNYEISNILYTSTYNYKIKITDTFTTTETTINVKTDKVPTGVSVWTEYKDRVDFIRATIGGSDIIESGNGYIKYYDGTMFCFGEKTTEVLSWFQDGIIYLSRNHTLPNFAKSFVNKPFVFRNIEYMNITGRDIWLTGTVAPTKDNPGNFNLATYWNATDTTCTISYFAIGRWK